MFSVVEWLTRQWPFVVSGAAAIVGITSWVQHLKAIQELRLKVKTLERQLADAERRVVVPTADDVFKYGRSTTAQSRSHLPTLLLLVALIVPIASYTYGVLRARKLAAASRAQLATVIRDLDAAQRQLEMTNTILEELQQRAIRELAGEAGTSRPGAGPAYAALKRQEAALRQQQVEAQRSRDALDAERRRLEAQLAR